MGTIVTFPRERHASGEQMGRGGVKDEMDREIMARVLVENVARWIDDPDRDEIVNMDLPPRRAGQEADSRGSRGDRQGGWRHLRPHHHH